MKKGYLNQKYLCFAQFFVGILDTLSPLNRNWFGEISGMRGYSFEIIQKIGSHLEKSGQF